MNKLEALLSQLQAAFGEELLACDMAYQEITLEIHPDRILSVAARLKEAPAFLFEVMIDLCAVDYLHYGISEWDTRSATNCGFERAVKPIASVHANSTWEKPRLAVVYHLLSITHNHRIRLKAFVKDDAPMIDSVTPIWRSANWYEREAFDLFGILFKNHPDLRRILTDYGFIGHPFRKDFPLVGNVEVRFDATANRVIYEPVDIVPRTLVPKVIRGAS